MTLPSRPSTDELWFDRIPHGLLVPVALAVTAVLAFTSYVGDSITADEMSHLTSGMSYLQTGDFRLAPDHPPLPKLWAALPLLFVDHAWPDAASDAWRRGDVWRVGENWLFELNDGERLLVFARGMVVLLLLAVCTTAYAVTRSLLGRRAALVALAVATLSPTLLAHGCLVTTDLPLALFSFLALLAAARTLQRVTGLRLLGLAGATAAASLSKFSWPLLLPPMLLMAAVVIFREPPFEIARWRVSRSPTDASAKSIRLTGRPLRVAAVSAIALFVAVVVWLSIWTCYGWRFSPFRTMANGSAMMVTIRDTGRAPPKTMDEAWETILHDLEGRPARGLVAAFVRGAREHRLLPEAYLYGLAYTRKSTLRRPSYLLGRVRSTGRAEYFPIAFAIKTPVAMMVLLAAGTVALARRRSVLVGDNLLAIGLAAFVCVYGYVTVTAGINIGHRHLLPLYPPLIVLAGAAAGWLGHRAGRWLTGALLLWLAVTNLAAHPHYLSYFNELSGGPDKGHLYLADSNIDWGQDLKRLARYAKQHPHERIKLAYFGSAPPWHYGFECEMLPSYKPVDRFPAKLSEGTYVISVTQLLGVYDRYVGEAFWANPANTRAYARLAELAAAPASPGESRAARTQRERARKQFQQLRPRRLLSRLRARDPDQRIGQSLFVFHLSQADVDRLTQP